jgi:hypothetical protein
MRMKWKLWQKWTVCGDGGVNKVFGVLFLRMGSIGRRKRLAY